MTGHGVVIAGGGPTGSCWRPSWPCRGVDVVIVERRASQTSLPAHAQAVCTRARSRCSISVGSRIAFSRRRVALQVAGLALQSLSTSATFRFRHTYGLALWQDDFERILAAWVGELGVPITREREVTGFTQDETGVDVELSDGRSLRAEYLVGCDGGRSVVRKTAGIEFSGWDPSTSWLIAEVEMDEEPEFGLRPGGGIGQREDGRIRIVLADPQLEHGEPTLQDVREALVARRRDGLRGPQPDLDLPLHRHDPAGRVLPRRPGADRGRRRPRASTRKEDKASTPACRMP